MSEVLERITKAILPAFQHIEDKDYRLTVAGCWARGALEAIREPTEEVISAITKCELTMGTDDYFIHRDSAASIWRKTIDGLLQPTTSGSNSGNRPPVSA